MRQNLREWDVYFETLQLNRFSWTKEELNTYEQEEKRELDALAIREQLLAEGEARGEARGEVNKGRKVAKHLIKSGVSMDIIMEATGLTREEIQGIKEGADD